MKVSYSVEKLKNSIIGDLPDGWTPQKHRELLEEMNIDGISESTPEELKEMCMMSLTDNEPEDAANIVLKYLFQGRLSSGQIDNISNEMLDEKMWEEYPALSLHEDFFNATSLLHNAFNGSFPTPKAVSFQVIVTAKDQTDLDVFSDNIETPLIRLLAQGMPETTLINRLFDEKLTEGLFEESADIIWQVTKTQNGAEISFDVISSLYWFQDIEEVGAFEAELNIDES